jgi:allophanate hydrolase subunit 2
MGGYPKLGAVIATDCRRLTQARAGTRVTFQAITLEEAKHLAWLEAHYQETLQQALIQP